MFKAKRAKEIFIVAFLSIISVFGMYFSINIIDSYALDSILYIIFIAIIAYQLYYMIAVESLKYSINCNGITIIRFLGLKKTFIDKKDIIGYLYKNNKISGIRLSGYNLFNINYGKCFEENIGLCKMFLTSNCNNFYIITKDITYVLSPRQTDEFRAELDIVSKDVGQYRKQSIKGKVELYKDKQFIIPFIVASILCIINTGIPLVLYVLDIIPKAMPLKFNSLLQVSLMGTAKQFASKQIAYGVGSMTLLICMYYAAQFTAKFDKKSSYIYTYVSLAVVAILLMIQLELLYKFL
ncbi:MAG: PH domain-containing protein [Clostridium sp.]